MTTEAITGRRIVIHGCSGSGKSTLARRLGASTGLPVIELDALFHRPNWQETPKDEFRAAVSEALDEAERAHGGWIADGNYDSSLEGMVRARADVVLWFDLPRRVVMSRVIRRTLSRAITRRELWHGNREHWSNIFRWDPQRSIIRWSWTHHPVYRARLTAGALVAPDSQRWIRLATPEDAERVVSAFSC